MNDNWLTSIQHPSRYMGGEVGQILKKPEDVDVRVCLAFPEVYEIGMSHQGLAILYHALNAVSWIGAERFFLPWIDLLDKMRKESACAVSLENRTPLGDFHILGITLQYELTYTNVLALLELAGLPLRSADRKDTFPLVLGGGPCASNPEPLAPFFDAFLIGDGEEASVEISHAVREAMNSGEDKAALLQRLSRIEGVYVPSLYEPEYDATGRFKKIKYIGSGEPFVNRRIVADLDAAPYPEKPIVPFKQNVHDRIALEIARGCTRGCRFCQAGIIYRPVRERSPKRILEILEKSLDATGFEDISLLSLSSGDYTCIESLTTAIMDRYAEKNVALSLPSLRVESVGKDLVEKIRRVRKTGFTLAPEAGSESLRQRINKPISDEQLLSIAKTIFGAGWNLLKLYFMIGLPYETEEDRMAICELARKVRGTSGKPKRKASLNINVSTFVPKSHTPFQWTKQLTPDEARERLERIRRGLKDYRIQMRSQNVRMSWVEGYLARGNRRAADTIEEVYRRGGIYDGWHEHFRPQFWEEAAQAAGLPMDDPAVRNFEPGDPLAWNHIRTRTDPEFLMEEWEKTGRFENTPDCRKGECSDCGVCGDGVKVDLKEEPPPVFTKSATAPASVGTPLAATGPRTRVRLKYAKHGTARLLGHQELSRLFQRAIRRAGLPIAFSEGFHPNPRIVFGPPLGLGIESDCEYVDLTLEGVIQPSSVMEALKGRFPLGLSPVEVSLVNPKAKALFEQITALRYHATGPGNLDLEKIKKLQQGLENRVPWPVTLLRKRKKKQVDLTEFLLDLSIVDERTVSFLTAHRITGSIRPREVLSFALDLSPEEESLWTLRKTGTRFADEQKH